MMEKIDGKTLIKWYVMFDFSDKVVKWRKIKDLRYMHRDVKYKRFELEPFRIVLLNLISVLKQKRILSYF